jgi:hypothetical protein
MHWTYLGHNIKIDDLGRPSIGGLGCIELLPLGGILDCHPTMDQAEALHLFGDLEVAQSLKHQVSNANATNFPLLHRVV